MKKLNLYIMVFIAALLSSCSDDDKLALDTESDLGKGAFLRTVSIESGGYDFFNLDTSAFSVIVEEDDAQGGALLESVDVYVRFTDKSPSNGGTNISEKLVKSIPASAFSAGPNGLPRTTITVPTAEAVAALGISADDLQPGDIFGYRLAVNLTDGQTFSSNNSGGNLNGTFFNSPFRYNASVGCPLPDNFLGDYQVTLVEGSGGFGSFSNDSFTATLTAKTATQRQFSFVWLPGIGGFDQVFEIEFVCTTVSAIRHSTGLGCGGGSIVWSQSSETPQDFDINDDSSFTLRFQDFVEDGGCGVGSYPVELQFTKL
jgi:hypothetical protein